MDNNILEYVGKSLYQIQYIKEYKRYVVFRTRCLIHSDAINKLITFFDENAFRQALLKGTPSFLEQTTRAFFYKDSTWQERMDLVKGHISYMEQAMGKQLMEELYVKNQRVVLWQDQYLEKPITMELWFHGGQRKEGCLSLVLSYEGEELYQIMFWFGQDKENPARASIYIGALQGIPNGSELIKGLTKAYFGYRTKNLIFYGLRSLAKALDMEHIYAVGNEGYYAMNHVRMDRKLKTDFGAFWTECEGNQCPDKRFYVMPVEEHRKSMEELKPSKRAQHRRRFAKMDEIEQQVAEALGKYAK